MNQQSIAVSPSSPSAGQERPTIQREESYVIPPPLEAIYDSEREAIAALHRWTCDHGFNVTRRRVYHLELSDYEAVKIVWKRAFACDRPGKPKCTQHLTDEYRVRTMRGSKRSGCGMIIVIQAVSNQDPNGAWTIVHTSNNSELHNHPPSQDPRVHAGHRQRAAKAEVPASQATIASPINAQVAAGIPVGLVRLTLLHNDQNSMITSKDIANARQAQRSKELSTQTLIEAVFGKLSTNNFFYRYTTDPNTNEIRHLFWAYPVTSEMFRLHPDVLVMDCTYKTNLYNIPLLNIVSVTAFNTVLPVAQCWLPGETQEDYVWTLNMLQILMIEKDIPQPDVIMTDRDLAFMNAVSRVFAGIPAMVCRWHMNNNVIARTHRELGQLPVLSPAPGQPKYGNAWETDQFLTEFFKAVKSKTEAQFELHRLL